MGGCGRCSGLGLPSASSRVKKRPWMADGVLGPQPPDDGERLVEHLDTCCGAGELDPVAAVLVLVPPGADAEFEPTAGHVVDRHGHLRQHRRIAVGHRTDQAAHPGIAGQHRHARQHRPALERGLRRVDESVEVVVVPDAVESQRVRGPPELLQHRVVERGRELHRNQHGRNLLRSDPAPLAFCHQLGVDHVERHRLAVAAARQHRDQSAHHLGVVAVISTAHAAVCPAPVPRPAAVRRRRRYRQAPR